MKIWRILPIAVASCGLMLCAAFASVAPEPEPEEPVISNIEEIPMGQLAMPISTPAKSDAPLSAEAEKSAQPDVPPADVSATAQAENSEAASDVVKAPTVAGTPEEILAASPVESPLGGLMNTMTALNVAIVSLGRITSTGDRVVLDAERREILANLKLSDLENEPEIVALYSRMVETLSAHRLTEDEMETVARIYDARQRRALNTALSSLKVRELDIFFATLFSRGANAYFGYREVMSDVHDALSWKLGDETVAELNGLQKEFLAAGARLQIKYGLPENLRLTQEEVDYFEGAIAQTDDAKALEMYPVLLSAFASYPPFWLYWAQAAASSDVEQTLSSLGQFDLIRRPVLRRDPFLAQAMKMRIVLEEWTSDERLAELLTLFRENMDEGDWLDNLFYGTVTWASGDCEGGIAAVRNNILQKRETRVSEVVLAAMENENFDVEKFRTAFRAATADEPQGPTDRAALFAWLGGHDSAAMKLAQSSMDGSSPLPYLVASQILRKSSEIKSDKALAATFEDRHAELARRDASAYVAVLTDVNVAAGQKNARAQLLLGMMYENGWGVMRDLPTAARCYALAAEQGNEVAQMIYAAMCERGTGMKKNPSEAFKWYSRAAKSGDERAQYEVGRMYRTGTGVKRDLASAARNFQDSALGGYAPAQAALGELYRKGAGVKRDLVESYKWSWLAKLNGEKSAQANLNVLEGKGIQGAKLDQVKRALAKSQAQKLYDQAHGK